ncbi:MAG: hypothetical protein Q8910_00325 [Bacteroidota bacterium]|nr:hypothetical protein [Bacteroidota bacterium]
MKDLKPQYEETLKDIQRTMLRQEKVVEHLERMGKFDEEYDYESNQLAILRRMFYDKKYELDYITLGHAPDDHSGIFNLRVGENEFADRSSKKDSRMAKRARNNIQDYRR